MATSRFQRRRRNTSSRWNHLSVEQLESRRLLAFTGPEVAQLLATGAATDDFFGSSVGVSGDTAVVGDFWKLGSAPVRGPRTFIRTPVRREIGVASARSNFAPVIPTLTTDSAGG